MGIAGNKFSEHPGMGKYTYGAYTSFLISSTTGMGKKRLYPPILRLSTVTL
jgi:hypothetical protein